MTDPIARAFNRTHDRLEQRLGTDVEVFQPTESTDHTGTTTDYPDSPTDTVRGVRGTDTATSTVGTGGSDTDRDATLLVRGTGIDWTARGEAGAGPTAVRLVDSGERYRVATITESHGEVLKLGLVGDDS